MGGTSFFGSVFLERSKLTMPLHRLMNALGTLLHERKSLRKDTMMTLAAAAKEGNKDALLLSLDAGAAVDEMDCYHMTPLMHAARNGHLDCVRLLIGRGAGVRHRSADDRTAAHYAAERGNVEILRALIASCVDLLALAGGVSVLDSACLASEMDAASFALACGCRFALSCREIASQAFYGFNRVVYGLSAVNCTL